LHRRAILLAAALLAVPAAANAALDLELRPMFSSGTAPEIVDFTPDEMTMVATQGASIGVWDMTNPDAPVSKNFATPSNTGTPGESKNITSVAVISNRYALAAAQVVDTTNDRLWVIDLQANPPAVVREILIADGPDSVAVAPNKQRAVIAVENECEGGTPNWANSAPCSGVTGPVTTGSVDIVDISASNPNSWTVTNVPVNTAMAQTANLVDPTDVQPEFVDVSPDSTKAAVTLQENNGIGILDLATGTWDRIWSAGTVGPFDADISDASPATILFTSLSLTNNREPDAIKWMTNGTRLITANEGEAADADNVDASAAPTNGGTRGYTIWTTTGAVVADTSTTYDKQIADFGFDSDNRSTARGTEPEGLDVATIDGTEYAFVNNERGFSFSMIDVSNPASPRYVTLGPTGEEPEGIKVMKTRKYVVTANEAGGQFSILRFVDSSALDPNRPLLKGTDTPFMNATGLGVQADGSLLFTDQNKPNFIRKATTGTPGYAPFTNLVTVDVALAAATLYDVTPAPGGGYWAAVQGFGTVDLVKLSATGALDTSVTLSTNPTASGVAVSTDGATVYVSSTGGTALTRYTVSGGATDSVTVPASATPAGTLRLQDLDMLPNGDLVAVEAVTPGSSDSTKSGSNLLRITNPAALAASGTATTTLLKAATATEERSNRSMSGVARASEGDVWTLGAQRSGRAGNTDLRLFLDMGPTNTAAPAITGTATMGSTLTCSNGTWTGATSYTREWLRDGTAIGSATGTTYVSTLADVGKSITCRVTAVGADGTNRATSAGLTVTAASSLVPGTSGSATGTISELAINSRASANCVKGKRTTTCTIVTRLGNTEVKALRGTRTVKVATTDASGRAKITVSRITPRGHLRFIVGGNPLAATFQGIASRT